MSSTARDLLLRVIAVQLEGRRCPGCGRVLAEAPIVLRQQREDAAVAEVRCKGCGHEVLLEVKPGSDGGVAGAG
jgi:ribosomal protein S27E